MSAILNELPNLTESAIDSWIETRLLTSQEYSQYINLVAGLAKDIDPSLNTNVLIELIDAKLQQLSTNEYPMDIHQQRDFAFSSAIFESLSHGDFVFGDCQVNIVLAKIILDALGLKTKLVVTFNRQHVYLIVNSGREQVYVDSGGIVSSLSVGLEIGKMTQSIITTNKGYMNSSTKLWKPNDLTALDSVDGNIIEFINPETLGFLDLQRMIQLIRGNSEVITREVVDSVEYIINLMEERYSISTKLTNYWILAQNWISSKRKALKSKVQVIDDL